MNENSKYWVQTYTGRKFVLSKPLSGDIGIEDIAHSLAYQCRFAGHCREFYSIAEHSVRAAQLVRHSLRKQALLHDAAEAYIGDITRPMKRLIPAIVDLEREIWAKIAERFDIKVELDEEVRYADNVMLATEARDLMTPPPEPWESLPEPLPHALIPWAPVRAESWFLSIFYALDGESC